MAELCMARLSLVYTGVFADPLSVLPLSDAYHSDILLSFLGFLFCFFSWCVKQQHFAPFLPIYWRLWEQQSSEPSSRKGTELPLERTCFVWRICISTSYSMCVEAYFTPTANFVVFVFLIYFVVCFCYLLRTECPKKYDCSWL